VFHRAILAASAVLAAGTASAQTPLNFALD
jgi:hypothetical protein